MTKPPRRPDPGTNRLRRGARDAWLTPELRTERSRRWTRRPRSRSTVTPEPGRTPLACENPRYVALLCHGYGEHSGRYEYVAARLVADGAVVYAIDHAGHGLSDGERVLVEDFEKVVDDFHLLDLTARRENRTCRSCSSGIRWAG